MKEDLCEDQLGELKKLPKFALEKMGVSGLELSESDDTEFLSQSSILEEDFKSLKQDDFPVTNSEDSIVLPDYDPFKKYDDCFYSVLV